MAIWKSRYEFRMRGMHRWAFDDLDPTLRDARATDLLYTRNMLMNTQALPITGFSDEEIRLTNVVLSSKKHSDVTNLSDLPKYGPSVAYLVLTARSAGIPDELLIEYFCEWSDRISPSWLRDDERKSAGLPEYEPEVTRRLGVPAKWRKVASLDVPWIAEVAGELWEARLNDFPDEWMYSLIVDGTVLGDFHDWPQNWDRGEEYWPEPPTPKVKRVKPVALVSGAEGRWMGRFEAGECAAVWTEMSSLGPDVRKKKYLAPAEAVASETMRRAKRNFDKIRERLIEMEFEPKYGNWREPTPADEVALLGKAEAKKFYLPLSVRAGMIELGTVSLLGTHPQLNPNTERVTTDALEVVLGMGLEAIYERWLETPPKEREDEMLDMIPDAESKLEMLDGAEPGEMYGVMAPDAAADAKLVGDPAGRTFVEHLRWSFLWGGFPGWEKEKARPERELAKLREGLEGL